MEDFQIKSRFRVRQWLSRLLIVSVLVLLVLIAVGIFTVQSATASIRQIEEAPGQILYQSQYTLPDDRGNYWQVVLFKRVASDQIESVSLRLVGFPGVVEFVHPQPLKITTDAGQFMMVEDMFAEQSPGANVGQYNIKQTLSQLPTATSLNLSLPMSSNQVINLKIPAVVVLEWQAVAGEFSHEASTNLNQHHWLV